MDPAGPGYETQSDEVRLESSDAEYVQCIFTDGNVFGTATDYGCGYHNFYINGGNSQPGCSFEFKDLECDHTRATEYFQESLSPNNRFWGIECPINGSVPIEALPILVMGVRGEGFGVEAGNFCVKTKSESPYAIPLNEVTQLISNDVENAKQIYATYGPLSKKWISMLTGALISTDQL